MRRIGIILLLTLSVSYVSATEFMHPEEIRPGMKGYGLSVFRGWEPEKFEVEIIDVMRDTFPGEDMILARATGQGLEKSGVIAGMSGSPVYINDKLIGAVAYTWSFSKEPICGITPIRMMLEEKKNTDPRYFEKMGLKKIATPIAISGFTGEALDFVMARLSNKGFVPTAGTGGSSLKSPSSTLKGGDAVALNLVDGDLDISAVGTVTYVDGKDIYIFGHPMGLSGNVALPMSRAYIYTVVPSTALSFKMGSSSEPVGTSRYDGQAAVYGLLGEKPNMVPVEMNIHTARNPGSYHYRVTSDKEYFSWMVSSSMVSSVLMKSGMGDDKSLIMRFRIDVRYLDKQYTISNSFSYYDIPSFFSLYGMMFDLSDYFYTFQYNNFGEVKVDKVTVDVEVIKGVDYYTIESVNSDKDKYVAGDTVQLRIGLRRYQGNYFTKLLRVKIPEQTSKGKYSIYVGNESSINSTLYRLYPHYYYINDFPTFLKFANRRDDKAKLMAMFVDSDSGVIINSMQLPGLPESYIDLLNYTTESGKPFQFPITETDGTSLDLPIFGSSLVKVDVIEKQGRSVGKK